MQSMGYAFRSVVVADFIGTALKSAIDCRDADCLRAERVEEIMEAQRSFMGVPRSVGDFFVWSPTLTKEVRYAVRFKRPNLRSFHGGLTMGGDDSYRDDDEADRDRGSDRIVSRTESHRVYKFEYSSRRQKLLDSGLLRTVPTSSSSPSRSWSSSSSAGDGKGRHAKSTSRPTGRGFEHTQLLTASSRWANVNVTQPLDNIHAIPDNIPVVIGTNKHEGQVGIFLFFVFFSFFYCR